LLLLLPLCAGAGEAAVWTPAREESTHRESYILSLFPEDQVLRNPNGGAAAYLTLLPETRVSGPAVLDLWYSYSPIVIPDISTMTVSLNGTPVDSRILRVDGAARSNVSIRLPGEMFVTGQNEIEIAVVHRTIDGLCRDIDNSANWFIIRGDTRLGFVLESGEYDLACFPRPFADPYHASKVNTVAYLPEDWDENMLSAALNIGALLGQSSAAGSFPKRIQTRVGEPGQVPANEIVFGRTSELFPDAEEAFGAPVPADAPVLSLEPLADGYARLVIAADDSKAFARAAAALSRPQLVRTLTGRRAALLSPLAPASPGPLVELFRDKKQLFTIEDYGYAEDIPVTGAFHQESLIVLRRPPNYRTGSGSYIELRFRHSRILDPKKSAVTVYINDIPIRAAALTPENADGGVLRAPIPASELNRSFWNVRFGFYHDLGIVDCSKRYDEVAWSVIEKESCVYFNRGRVPYVPVWDNFPFDLPVNPSGRIEATALFTMDKPTQSDFTSAFILAYYMGVQNGASFLWRARVNAEGFDPETAPGTIIALGRNNDVSAWSGLSKLLTIYPTAEGFAVERSIDVTPSTLGDHDIYQIARVNDAKWLYAFMFKQNGRMNDLLDYSTRDRLTLSGQISLTDARGKVTSFNGLAAPQENEAEQGGAKNIPFAGKLEGFFGGSSGTVAMYIVILGVVLVFTILITFLSRRRR